MVILPPWNGDGIMNSCPRKATSISVVVAHVVNFFGFPEHRSLTNGSCMLVVFTENLFPFTVPEIRRLNVLWHLYCIR